jgi:hypothetical protein
VHLIDEEQGAASRRDRGLADLPEQLDEVLLGISRVGHPGHGSHVELQLYASWRQDAERFHHPEGSLDPVSDAVLAAHLPEQTRRHLGEGGAEVGLRADLLNVRRGPSSFGGQDVELHEKDCLAHPSQAVIDKAALGPAGAEDIDQRGELVEVRVPPGQVGRLAAGPGGVRVVPPLPGGKSNTF